MSQIKSELGLYSIDEDDSYALSAIRLKTRKETIPEWGLTAVLLSN